MVSQNRRRNDERMRRDDDNRDWRSAGDDWHRGESRYRHEYHRDRGMQEPAEYGGRRDASDWGNDDVRRRSSWRPGSEEPFSATDEDAYGPSSYGPSYGPPYGGRPGGTFGPARYAPGQGSRYYGREEWNRGDFGLGWQGLPEDRDHYRGRRGRPYGYGPDNERGFWDRASDEVASWFGDEDAERRREQDAFRGRGPKGYTRSDDRIREDVSDRLTEDPFVDASDIEVAVSGGEVTLSGTVVRREQRRRAEDCAERVSGVTYIQNNIRVKEQPPTASAVTPTLGEAAFGRDASAPPGDASTIGQRPQGHAR